MNKLQAATDTFRELAFYYFMLLLIASSLFTLIEGTSLMDSVYWAVATSTSTGYGDVSAKTAMGKVLSMLLMPFSIFFLGPLVVVRLMQSIIKDQNEFSHHEQEELKARLENIENLLKGRNNGLGDDNV